MKLSIIMPVYNEIDTLSEIIKRVKDVPFDKEIIIIDDYSTDGSREFISNIYDPNIKIILNPKNMGKGYCIRQGLKYITGDIVIFQDADLEYSPEEYGNLIKYIVEGMCDIVYGTRFGVKKRIKNYYHYFGNRLLNLICNILYKSSLTDLMTCYKVFRSNIISSLDLHSNGFGIESEITAKILIKGLRIYETPITYNRRAKGKKINWTDFFKSLYWLIICKFRS